MTYVLIKYNRFAFMMIYLYTGGPCIVRSYGTRKTPHYANSHCLRTIYVVNDQSRQNKIVKSTFCHFSIEIQYTVYSNDEILGLFMIKLNVDQELLVKKSLIELCFLIYKTAKHKLNTVEFVFGKEPVFQKNIKVFAVCTQFRRVLNTFMYFWNTGSFLKTNSVVSDLRKELRNFVAF